MPSKLTYSCNRELGWQLSMPTVLIQCIQCSEDIHIRLNFIDSAPLETNSSPTSHWWILKVFVGFLILGISWVFQMNELLDVSDLKLYHFVVIPNSLERINVLGCHFL